MRLSPPVGLRFLLLGWALAFGAGAFADGDQNGGKMSVVAATPAPATSIAPPPAGKDVVATQSALPGDTRELSLSQMGAYGAIKLRGTDPTSTLNVSVRNDEVVTAAKLTLVYTYSPSLIFELSHLKVSINGEIVTTPLLDKATAGQPVTKVIDLDPRLFTDFNRINVQMIAHYTLDHCEDPFHSTLWADISPYTKLSLTTSRVSLPTTWRCYRRRSSIVATIDA